MKSCKKVIRRISERPRLVFTVLMLVLTIFFVAKCCIDGDFSLMVLMNYILGWLSIVAFFVLSIKWNGYKIATSLLLVITPIVAIMSIFWIRDYSYGFIFVVPASMLSIACFDYSRLESRKNIFLAAVLIMIVVACFIVGFRVKGPFNVGALVIASLMTVLVFLIKKAVKFNGVHFSLKKYFVPKQIKKVSAVIPNYNYANYLRERVDSILFQNYPIYELIILDDKSTDNSVKVIEKIVKDIKASKPELIVKFIPNEVNSGNVFKQWEKCFKESSGDYVWICEADDSCSKYFLNTTMRAFDDDDVVISYTESCTIDEFGKKQKRDLRDWIDMFDTGHWKRSYVLDGKKELGQVLCVNNTIANVSGVVFRKKAVFEKYLREAQRFTLAGDWYFYSKVLLNGKIAYDDESLNYHRMHTKGVTLTTDNYVHYDEIIEIQNSISQDVKLGAEARKKVAQRRSELIRTFGFSKEELKYIDIPLKDILRKKKISDDVLLSVIVCAYNVGEYVGGCLKSVLTGFPEKSEIIVVDDGSTDNTAEIVKNIAENDPRIKYFHKKNGGLSSAKNYGLTKASGRYVIFMDADDKVASDGYAVMLKKAIESDADMVICDMALVFDNGKVEYCSVYHDGYSDKMIGFMVDGLMASSNNKMIRRELFVGIKYPEGKNNEDVAVTPVLMALAKNIQYIPSAFYKYYQRKGSIQNSGFDKNRLVIFDTCKQAFSSIEKVVPDKLGLIKGIIVSNQLIAILVYVISDMKSIRKRNAIICDFVKRYKELDVAGNDFVNKYIKMIGMPKLNKYILNKTPEQICGYIRRCKNRETVNGYLGKIFNLKKGKT